jgi:hypothetical protein
MLIPYPRIPGEDLSIQDFCSLYDLDNDIWQRFNSHKYKRTISFKFIEVDELKEMGSLRGEIAELTGDPENNDNHEIFFSRFPKRKSASLPSLSFLQL